MALSNISKDHLNNLLVSINGIDVNTINSIKSNYMQFGQLKLIAEQMEMLKLQAKKIINDSYLQDELHSINTPFKLVNGNTYYLYQNSTKKYFSLLSPQEWNNKDDFLGSYLYDYDNQFIFQS